MEGVSVPLLHEAVSVQDGCLVKRAFFHGDEIVLVRRWRVAVFLFDGTNDFCAGLVLPFYKAGTTRRHAIG